MGAEEVCGWRPSLRHRRLTRAGCVAFTVPRLTRRWGGRRRRRRPSRSRRRSSSAARCIAGRPEPPANYRIWGLIGSLFFPLLPGTLPWPRLGPARAEKRQYEQLGESLSVVRDEEDHGGGRRPDDMSSCLQTGYAVHVNGSMHTDVDNLLLM